VLNEFSTYSKLIDNIKSEYSHKETDKALIKQIDDMFDFDGLDIKQMYYFLFENDEDKLDSNYNVEYCKSFLFQRMVDLLKDNDTSEKMKENLYKVFFLCHIKN